MGHPDGRKLVARGAGKPCGAPRTVARVLGEPLMGLLKHWVRVLPKSRSPGTSPGPWGHMLTQMSGFIAELR